MKTNMDVRSLGERESNYTNSSVRQMNQKNQTNSPYKKNKNKKGSGVLTASLIGAGVGVVAGMLLAPKTGKDLRKQVTDSASKLGTQASDLYSSSRDKVSSLAGLGNKSGASSASTTPKTGTQTNITPGREINNDPATSITM